MSTRPRVTLIFFSVVVCQEVRMEMEIKQVDKKKDIRQGSTCPH
jgi:hypothetical protein